MEVVHTIDSISSKWKQKQKTTTIIIEGKISCVWLPRKFFVFLFFMPDPWGLNSNWPYWGRNVPMKINFPASKGKATEFFWQKIGKGFDYFWINISCSLHSHKVKIPSKLSFSSPFVSVGVKILMASMEFVPC